MDFFIVDAVMTGITTSFYICSFAYVLTHVLQSNARNVVVATILMHNILQLIIYDSDGDDSVPDMVTGAFVVFAQFVSLFIVLENINPAAVVWAFSPFVFWALA